MELYVTRWFPDEADWSCAQRMREEGNHVGVCRIRSPPILRVRRLRKTLLGSKEGVIVRRTHLLNGLLVGDGARTSGLGTAGCAKHASASLRRAKRGTGGAKRWRGAGCSESWGGGLAKGGGADPATEAGWRRGPEAGRGRGRTKGRSGLPYRRGGKSRNKVRCQSVGKHGQRGRCEGCLATSFDPRTC